MGEKETLRSGVEQRYGNIRDTAKRYGLTEKALRARVWRRQLPFIREGKRIYFDWRRLDRERTRHTYGSDAPPTTKAGADAD